MATHAPGFEAHVLEQLALLERRTRRLKVALALVLILAVVAAVASAVVARLPKGGTPLAKTVEAQEFILRDESGAMRASLGMLKEGVALTFSDPEGSVRLVVSAEEARAGLSILDKKGEPIVRLSVTESGPALELNSEGGAGAMLRVIEKKAIFRLLDEGGKPIFTQP